MMVALPALLTSRKFVTPTLVFSILAEPAVLESLNMVPAFSVKGLLELRIKAKPAVLDSVKRVKPVSVLTMMVPVFVVPRLLWENEFEAVALPRNTKPPSADCVKVGPVDSMSILIPCKFPVPPTVRTVEGRAKL
ncbi:MAG TPA: hypothetical protein VH934_09565 [Xanthobacteraceae bacterium]